MDIKWNVTLIGTTSRTGVIIDFEAGVQNKTWNLYVFDKIHPQIIFVHIIIENKNVPYIVLHNHTNINILLFSK